MTKKIADCDCYVCDGATVWCADKNGKAYYACQHCGTRVFMGVAASNQLKASIVNKEEKQDGKAQKIQTEQRIRNTGKTTTAATGTGDDTAAADGGRRSGGLGIFGI